MIRIIIHDLESDKILSYKESKRMVESYWSFCHGKCCGNGIPYDEKEQWFCHSHEEHHDGEIVCDTVEWIWEPIAFGVRL